MDFDLTEEQRLILDTWRQFLAGDIGPAVAPFSDAPMPKALVHELLRKLLPFGVGCGWIPEGEGGLGLDLMTSGLLYEELARVSPDLAGTAFINEAVALLLYRLGSTSLRDRYMRPTLRADLIGCSAITEPGVGSNVRDIRTRAVRDGAGYRISGEKNWISNGNVSDYAVVLARATDSGADDLSLFLVDRAEKGYQSRDLHKLGLNGWSTAQLVFDDALVPEGNRVGEPGAGLSATLKLFERARCFVALLSIGIAHAALEAAISYACQREQWGRPIAGHQLVQEMIADMATELDCARLLTYRALFLVQKGVRCEAQAAMAKYYATEAAIRITSNAIQVHGSYGLSREFPVEQYFRNARMLTIPDGTSQIQKLIIGRNLLGMPAFGDFHSAQRKTGP